MSIAFYANNQHKFAPYSILSVLFLTFHMYVNPFKSKIDNYMATMSLLFLCLEGIILAAYPQPLPISAQTALIFFVVAPTAILIIWNVYERQKRMAARATAMTAANKVNTIEAFPSSIGMIATNQENTIEVYPS